MTEQQIPYSDYPIWAHYFTEQAQEKGIRLEKSVSNSVVSGPNDEHDAMGYQLQAERPNIACLEFAVRFKYKELSSARALGDIVDESIQLLCMITGNTDLDIRFGIKDGHARLEFIGGAIPGKLSIPYTTGIDYDPRQVIDYLIEAYLKNK